MVILFTLIIHGVFLPRMAMYRQQVAVAQFIMLPSHGLQQVAVQ